MIRTLQPSPMLSGLSDVRAAAGLSDAVRSGDALIKALKSIDNMGEAINRTARFCPMLSGLSDQSDKVALSDAVRSVRFVGKQLKSLVNKSDSVLCCSVRTALQGDMWTGQGGGMGTPPKGVSHPTPGTRPDFGLSDPSMVGGQP